MGNISIMAAGRNRRSLTKLSDLLAGGNLRSIGRANDVAGRIHSQSDFDELCDGLCHHERLVVMRSADAVEKVTRLHPEFLLKHKAFLLNLLPAAKNRELKWHLALILPRVPLTRAESAQVWDALSTWALDRSESRIVRVNSVQGLFDLAEHFPRFFSWLEPLTSALAGEGIPSINARIRKLTKSSRNS